jgi:hypothetical protein
MSVAAILARYHAEKAVHAQLRRDKIKLAEVADLQRRAATYLAEDREELLALAELTIAASPTLQHMVARQSVRNDPRDRTLSTRQPRQEQAIQR